jgi:hypothetical protein
MDLDLFLVASRIPESSLAKRHVTCREIMDSMFKPEKYDRVYLSAFLYVFTLTLPHSIAVNLAFGDNVLHQGHTPPMQALKQPF